MDWDKNLFSFRTLCLRFFHFHSVDSFIWILNSYTDLICNNKMRWCDADDASVKFKSVN